MIGKTISHYRITEELGRGGMGVVYKAEDTKLKRTVALKFLPGDLTADREARERFEREAQAAAALNHPNIIVVHEIGECEGQIYIAMEYVEGKSLREIVQAIPELPLPIDEIIGVATQVSEGLMKAHEKGIVHRDIKPGNILIDRDGRVKILDFGLAKLKGVSRLTKESSTLGTVHYMSPEQALGKEVDHRTDIWSLGTVLYELLTGEAPFRRDNEQAVLFSIINDTPAAVTEHRPEVPVELEWIVGKALEKEREDRYQDVGELLTDLRRLRRESVTPGRIQPPKMLERERKKRRFLRISVPLGAVVVAVLGVLFLRSLLFERVAVGELTPIAVISFENQTGDTTYDYLQKAIPSLLITNLEQSRYLRVTTWERMRDLLRYLGKEEAEIIDRDVGFELCRMDGVDAIVLGSYVKAGDVFATDVKVLDVETKRILKSANSQGEGVASIVKRQIDELSREISRGIGLSDRKIEASGLRIADVTTTSMDAYRCFLKGNEQYHRFYYDDARQFLEKAVELDSTFAMAYLALGWSYLELGMTKARDEAFEKARLFSNRATERERLYIEAAYAWFRESNPEEGFRILKQLVKQYPKEKQAHYALALSYRGNKLYPEAIDAFKKAIHLDPNYGRAINSLAYTYAHMGDFDKAIEYFEKYASVSPGDANPFDSMAEIYFRMGMLDAAIAKYKEALEVKSDFIYAYWSIAYVNALKENYREAMKWIDEFIAMAPSPEIEAEGLLWRGFYHYWLGCLERSLGDLHRAAEVASEAENAFAKAYADWVTAWIYYDEGELHLSRRQFNHWFEFVTKNPSCKVETCRDTVPLA